MNQSDIVQRYLGFALVFTALLLLMPACESKKSASDTDPSTSQSASALDKGGDGFVGGENADVFTFAMSADPETLDTGKMSGAPEGRVAVNIFEGLMAPGPTTQNVESDELVRYGVAESHEVSEDRKTYTFKLRKDAKWSNGDPVTSEDFAYAWKRILNPESSFAADYVHLLWLIEGAKQYHEGELDSWSEVGVQTVDEKTLKVTLKSPTPYFLELLAFYTFYPVPRKLVEKHGENWTEPKHIVSNGAYKLADYQPQQHIMLKKNKEYWDADNVSIDKAKIRIIPDQNAKVNAYKAGKLHWTGQGLPIAQITSLITHPDYYKESMLGTYYYRINVSKDDSVLTNQKVRRALALSIDRETIVKNTLNGLYDKANSFVPANMAGYESVTNTEYNVKKARKLLKEAGYPGGKGFPKIKVLYNTDKNHQLVAESIQRMWKENLDINVDLRNKEWKTYLQSVDALDYQIARAGWIGDYNDPMTFLQMWTTGNGNNDTGWSNEKYDQMIAKAKEMKTGKKREQIMQKAEQLLLEKGPVIPIYFYTNNLMVSEKVKGFEPHNRGIHLLKYLELEN